MISRELHDFERGYRDGLRGTYCSDLRVSHTYRLGHQQGASERLHRYINGSPYQGKRFHA